MVWQPLKITNDNKFPDRHGFKEQGNPGIIVLPNAPLSSDKFGVPLVNALQIVGSLALAYEKTKIIFSYNDIIEIIQRNKAGRIEKRKYRLDNDGGVFAFIYCYGILFYLLVLLAVQAFASML